MARPKLGQRVRAGVRLERGQQWDAEKGCTLKYWGGTWAGIYGIEGIYVGCRTLSNGIRQLQNYDEGYIYTATNYFEAWLVVEDERRRPVFVLPGDVEILNGGWR